MLISMLVSGLILFHFNRSLKIETIHIYSLLHCQNDGKLRFPCYHEKLKKKRELPVIRKGFLVAAEKTRNLKEKKPSNLGETSFSWQYSITHVNQVAICVLKADWSIGSLTISGRHYFKYIYR